MNKALLSDIGVSGHLVTLFKPFKCWDQVISWFIIQVKIAVVTVNGIQLTHLLSIFLGLAQVATSES